MNALTSITPETLPNSIAICDTLDGLAAIKNTGCAAAVLQRDIDKGLIDWLGDLAPENLPSARVIVAPNQLRKTLGQICQDSGTPDVPERQRLVDDVAELADHFAATMGVDMLRVRLDVITTNACRKFHIDALTARLICTYRGQTTQLGEAEQGLEPEHIWSVPNAPPLVLRGTRWPNDGPTPLRHRSPPIEGTGETRLLLVLDPIYDHAEHV